MENSIAFSIVAFHLGRGGRFHNHGHVTFLGEKEISDFTEDLYDCYENQGELLKIINRRENLEAKFYECCDNDDFTFFEKLGFNLGEKVWFTDTGNAVGLTESEVEVGVGRIDIDGGYNTTYTCFLKDCDQNELQLILDSGLYVSNDVLNYANEVLEVIN